MLLQYLVEEIEKEISEAAANEPKPVSEPERASLDEEDSF